MSETEDEYRTKEDEYRTKEDESVTEDEAELFDSDTEDEPESYVNSEAADADADSEDESALEAQLKRKYSFTLYIPLRHHRLWEEINNLPAVAEEKRKDKKYKYALRKALQDLKITASDWRLALNYFKTTEAMRGIGFIRFVVSFYPKECHSFVAAVMNSSKKHVVRKRKTSTENKYSNKLKRKRKAKSKPLPQKTQVQTRAVQTLTENDNAMTIFNDVISSLMTAYRDRWDTDVERVVKLSLSKMCNDLCRKASVVKLERSFRSSDRRHSPGPSQAAQFVFRAIRLHNTSRGKAPQVLWRRTSEVFECASFLHEALSRCVSSYVVLASS